MKTSALLALAVLMVASGCKGSDGPVAVTPQPPPPPPPPPAVVDTRPASVIVVSGQLLTEGRLQLALRNDSGPGAYYVEFRFGEAYLNFPGKPNPVPFTTSTQSVEVKPGYAETLDYSLSYNATTHRVDWAKVYSRALNSGTYKMTSCWQHRGKC